jgi:hypothetical protein
MADTLIVTNGDSAVERLAAAGITGTTLPWRDALHDGPVPAVGPKELARVRADFIATAFGGAPAEIGRSFDERDATIASHAGFARIEIWLEHDLYDQLQLVQILDRLALLGRTERVWLIQADDYLGLQPEASIRALADRAAPLTDAQVRLGQRAWSAFTAATPQGLAQLLSDDLDALPWLRPALLRLLGDLPDPKTGLALSEALILHAVHERAMRVGPLFGVVLQEDEPRFMGDATFFRWLDGLAFSAQPLVSGLPSPFPFNLQSNAYDTPEGKAYGAAEVALTAFGQEVVQGRADHARANAVDRWLGGTHLMAGTLWRWGREARKLIAPA